MCAPLTQWLPSVALIPAMALAALSALPALPAGADPQPCPDPMFRVDDPSGGSVEQTCALAVEARQHLALCGLVQTRPIDISLTDELIDAGGDCLAVFECDKDRLSILAPEAVARNLAEGDAYTLLPPDAVFRALLTHEMAHGLLSQTVGARPIARVDQEYVAAAMEFAALRPEHRQILLDANPATRPVEPESLNIWTYGFNPRGFGVRAWTHYQDNGCDVVHGIVSGAFTFYLEEF